MSKRKEKSKNRVLIYKIGLAIILLVLSFIALVFYYFHKFDRSLTAENRTHLAETTNQMAAHIYSIIEDAQTALEVTANAVSSIDTLPGTLDYLSETEKVLGIPYIGFAARDGILYCSQMKKGKDISQTDYFLAAMKGQTMSTDLHREIMEDKAVTGIYIAVPVKDEKGGVAGAVVALLDIRRLQSVLNASSFKSDGFTYLINETGDFVLHTKSMDFNNFYTVMQNVELTEGGGLEQLKNHIKKQEEGMAAGSNMGTEMFIYYVPLNFNNWTVLNVVDKRALTANTASLTKELAFLGVFSVMMFLILLSIAVAAFVNSRNQKQSTEMKSIFLANMSHELRTPMNAVIGASDLLQKEELTDQQQHYVQMISNSGNNLLTIINDILDFSKIESGKFTLTEDTYSLKSLIVDITTLIIIRIGSKPVRFYVDLDHSLPAQLIGDKTRIRQILINLLGNAVKFTETGFITLTISSTQENGTVKLHMVVKDTGIGIHRQDMDRLFTSFNQVDTHRTQSPEGTGLGLAISRQLTELMGGSIRAESTYGSGTSFTAEICQKPAGEEGLFPLHIPERTSVHIYEPCKELNLYYQKVMESFEIPYHMYSELPSLLSQAPTGTQAVIIAGKDTLSSQALEGFCKTHHCIPLLAQQEYGFLSDHTGKSGIYAPLFCLELPGAIGAMETSDVSKRISNSPEEMPSAYPNAKVLIVDDNEMNLEIAEAIMAPYEMHIDCLRSGTEAVEAVRHTDYDLVFMDHMMPVMDGVEALKKIRSLPGRKFQTLPIVALTANATREAQAMFQEKGFSGFLPKPIELDLLEEILRRWLQKTE